MKWNTEYILDLLQTSWDGSQPGEAADQRRLGKAGRELWAYDWASLSLVRRWTGGLVREMRWFCWETQRSKDAPSHSFFKVPLFLFDCFAPWWRQTRNFHFLLLQSPTPPRSSSAHLTLSPTLVSCSFSFSWCFPPMCLYPIKLLLYFFWFEAASDGMVVKRLLLSGSEGDDTN